MAITKTQAQYRARWGERIKTIGIAALSAVAARAAAEDLTLAVIAIIALVGIGEVVSDRLSRNGFRKRVRSMARKRNRRRGLWSAYPAGSKRRGAKGSAHR